MSSVTAVPIAPTKRSYLVWLWIGVIVAVAGAIALAWFGTARVVAEKGSNESYLAWNKGQSGVVETASGLQYQVLKEGEGASPTDSDVTLITYEGRLRDGTVFDARPQPVPMPVGGVVPGFSEALKLMKKGGKYRIWIKPELGYGANSPDPNRVPPNSLLVFEVSLLEFVPMSVYQQMMQQQMGGAPGGPPPGSPPPADQPKGN
jgi:hypothetical protein